MKRRLTTSGKFLCRAQAITGAALVAGAFFTAISRGQAQTCQLYPIALPGSLLSNAAVDTVLADIFQGTQPGNFGWLTWGGSPSEPTLVASLTPPGDSGTYVNPDNTTDHQVTAGDWVRGKPGVSNSKNVRDALDGLKLLDITVPVWDQRRGQGEAAAYHVSAFARVRLLSYQLPGQNRITARFLGYVSCAGQNLAPVVNAGPDQTVTLPAAATLQGLVTDDGLPSGGALTQSWSMVSGPGTVTFANATSPTTTASFSMSGTYVLRLTASDSQLTGSDEVIVTVNRENHPPTALAQSVATDEDTPSNITLQGTDADFDPLTYTVVANASYGILSGTPPNLVYTPIADYNGPDNFAFTVNDGLLDSAPAVVTITARPVNDRPVADSQSLVSAEDAPLPILLSGADVEGSALTYMILAGPTNGSLSGAAPNLVYRPNTNFHGLDGFTFKVNDGDLDSVAATVSLTITNVNDAPIVHAGADQLISLPTDTVNLAGAVEDDAFAPFLEITWSKVSGPGAVTFADLHAPSTTATFSASGVYRLRLTADDSFFIESDDVVITVNGRPAVNAGPDLTNTLPAGVVLNGVASDDGLPTNSTLTVTWSKLSGPGTVVFADPHATNTTATFSQSGIYVLQLVADDSLVSETDEVIVLVNHAPIVDAGSDQATTNLQVALLGTVADDGLPGGVAAAPIWTQVSGPGTVTFEDASSPTTTVTFSTNGTYVLRLSASDSLGSTSDDVTIYVNGAPIVNVGPDQTVLYGTALDLSATVQDDGLPLGGVLTYHWQVVSGPGVAAFTEPNAPITQASFDFPGTYVLRLTASDSQLTSSDELTVTVMPRNSPPTVSAGPDQLSTFPTSVTLNGSAMDDGRPAGSTLIVQWSKVSGPGAVTFANANSPVTTASFDAPGVYLLKLTASDSELSASAYATITVNGAPVVNAGPDLITTISNQITLNGSVIDDGLPFNQLAISWNQVSGPGAALFTQPNATVTTVRFTAIGDYVLRLSATDSNAVSSDDVLVSVRPAGANMPPFVSAGTNQTIAYTNSTTVAGSVTDDGLPFSVPLAISWSLVSGPGIVSFANSNTPETTASFSASGSYLLQLTASDTEFTVSAQVTITVYLDNLPPVVNAGADQTVTRGPVTLSGTASDDGLPAGGGLALRWTKVSGPGALDLDNPTGLDQPASCL